MSFKNLQIISNIDVLIIGAGSAGCAAALSVGTQNGLNTLLVERYGFLGGSSTQMLDTFYGFFTPSETPKKIVSGVPDRVVNELDKYGEIFLRPNTYGAGTGVNYNPERLKFVWENLIQKNGVKILMHTALIDVNKDSSGEFECIFWNKSGFFSVKPKRIIDASGDADFCHLAGYEYEIAGVIEPAQSMTTTFRMANVDLEKYEKSGGKKHLQKLMNETSEPLPRKEGSAHAMNIEGCISTVAVKVAGRNALNINELTEAEIEGRRQAYVYERFFQKEVPGYENSKIIGLSTQIGVRETRRIYGNYRLTKDDCMAANIPDNSILLCAAPIEDHRAGNNGESETYWQYIPKGGIYGVPYGTIVPRNSEKVWVIGRCFSATHDAHASCRSMAQTMAMGQAAGLAAVQSINESESASSLNISKLKDSLVKSGAILEVPSKQGFTGKQDWKLNF
jgi:FAD dependent oxidoreductase